MKKLVLFCLILWSQIAASQATASKYYSQSQPDTATYIREYQDVLDYATANGITHPPVQVKQFDNLLMTYLVNSGAYDSLRARNKGGYFYSFVLDDTAYKRFRQINWVDTGKYYLEEINPVNYIAGLGVSSGDSGYFKGFSYERGDSNLFNSYGFGGFVSDNYDSLSADATSIVSSRTSATGQTNSAIAWVAKATTVSYLDELQIKGEFGFGRSAQLVTDPYEYPNIFYAYRNSIDTLRGYIKDVFRDTLVERILDVSGDFRGGMFTFLAENNINYQQDYTTPIDTTIDRYALDTISHLWGGGNISHLLSGLKAQIEAYNANISSLVDPVNIMTNFYFQGTDSNNVLPIFPRYNDQFGMEFQLPRDNPDDIKIYRVTTDSLWGEGGILRAFDKCLADTNYNIVLIESSGMTDTTVFINYTLSESKGIVVYGQFAPSPGYRIHGVQFITRPGDAPVHFQHVRFGAGTDTLDGVARDSCLAQCVYDSVQGRLLGWTQYSERDTWKLGSGGVMDHCTFNFSTDELLQGRGSNQSYVNNMFAKPLDYPFHHKGKHAKGTIHFKQGEGEGEKIAFNRNLYAATKDRTPALGGQMTGVIQENYNYFAERAGLQLKGQASYPDDTLGGGFVMNINNIYWDLFEQTSFRYITDLKTSGALYVKKFDIDGVLYEDPYNFDGPLSDNKIIFTTILGRRDDFEPDSFLVDTPPFAYNQAPLIPRYKAKKFIYTFAGARPADRDTLEKIVINEIRLKQRVSPPEDMSYWEPLLRDWYANPTHTAYTLQDDSLTVDSTGYLGIERMADSLHWKVTYPDSIPWPGIEADPTGAFIYQMPSPYIFPKFEQPHKETAWRELA